MADEEKLPDQTKVAALKRAASEAIASGDPKAAAEAEKKIEAELGFERGRGGEAPKEKAKASK